MRLRLIRPTEWAACGMGGARNGVGECSAPGGAADTDRTANSERSPFPFGQVTQASAFQVLRGAQHARLVDVIKSVRHKGLRRFLESGNASCVKADHRKRLRMQLAALDTATTIEDMDIPGFRLHPLKGKRSGTWAIDVGGNWRLTFSFRDGHVHDLDYEDYH